MRISYQEFLSRTQKGTTSPIYLFSGEDEFRKEGAVKELKKSIFKSGIDELNLNLFYGEESTGSDIIKAASHPTLTGDKRLVIIKNADKLRVSAKAIIKNYSHSPFPSTCLVLLMGKNDYKFGVEVVFTLPSERESIAWIMERAKEKGWSISRQAALELKEKVGINTQILNNEIEKLTLYCWDKKNITPEDIRTLIGDSKKVIIFGITNAIKKSEAKKALTILKKLSWGEKKSLTNIIAWQMRQLASAKHGEKNIVAGREVSAPSFFQQELVSWAQELGWDRLKSFFRSTLQAEFDFKSGRFPPELVLELLIIRLCRSLRDS